MNKRFEIIENDLKMILRYIEEKYNEEYIEVIKDE